MNLSRIYIRFHITSQNCFIQKNSAPTTPRYLIKFGIRTFLLLCHRSPQKMPVRWARMYDICGMERWNSSQCSVLSIGEALPTFRHVVGSSYHRNLTKNTRVYIVPSLFIWMTRAPGIGTDQQNNWPHSWHSSIYPGPSKPTFSN